MPDLTREQILKMEAGPELDALVAERVMGWGWVQFTRYNNHFQSRKGRFLTSDPKWYCSAHEAKRSKISFVLHPCPYWQLVSFSSDIAADYEVLVFVRENWDKGKRLTFGFQLSTLFDDRWTIDDFGDIETAGYYYQPGDYSRAALAASIKLTTSHA